MATANLTSLASLAKEVYEPRLVSQLQDDAIGHKRIKSSSEGVTERAGGKYVDFPITVGRNPAVSYRAESEAIGTAGRGTYDEVHVPLYYGYGRLSVTGQMIDLLNTNVQAFMNAWETEQTNLKDSVAKDTNRIFYGNGEGALCAVATSMGGAGNSFVVDDIYWLELGMLVDIHVTGTSTQLVTNREITAIDRTTNTVTLSGATFTALTTHSLYREGNFTSATQREPDGLSNIVDSTGALYGVNPSSVDRWRSTETAMGGPLSETTMLNVVDDIRTEGGKVSVILADFGASRAYFNLLTQQRKFNDTVEFEGGLSGLAFNYGGSKLPVVADPDMRPISSTSSHMYFLDESSFKFYQTGDWKFADRDGSMFRWVSGYDEWECLLIKYWEIGCSRRNANGKLTGITPG